MKHNYSKNPGQVPEFHSSVRLLESLDSDLCRLQNISFNSFVEKKVNQTVDVLVSGTPPHYTALTKMVFEE